MQHGTDPYRTIIWQHNQNYNGKLSTFSHIGENEFIDGSKDTLAMFGNNVAIKESRKYKENCLRNR